jgi:hypothetical protein
MGANCAPNADTLIGEKMNIKVIPEALPYLDEKSTNLDQCHDVYIDGNYAGCLFFDVDIWTIEVAREIPDPCPEPTYLFNPNSVAYNSKDEAIEAIVEDFKKYST